MKGKKLPVAVVVSHSGLAVPPEVESRLALSERHIFNEADLFTEEIYAFREKVLHWHSFPIARAIIDFNRPADKSRVRPGDGIVKQQTSYGTAVYKQGQAPDAALEAQLIQQYWQPWHDKMAAIAADPDVKLVIDAHSMAAVGPSAYGDPAKLRPQLLVANLGDAQGERHEERQLPLSAPPALTRRFGQLLAESFAGVPELTETAAGVWLNRPFYGGWNIMAHGQGAQAWMMVEVNRGLYVGLQDGETAVSPPNEERITDIRQRLWQAIEQLALEL